jgi:hypothetical protein
MPFSTTSGYYQYFNFNLSIQQGRMENLDAQEYVTRLQEIDSLIQAKIAFTEVKQ